MPKLLDLFCGAGGCSVGYHRAGFQVTGVDNRPQPRYPFEFHQADAMTFPLDGYDVIHASPPCQDHCDLAHRAGTHGTGWMLEAIRKRFQIWGGYWVIENVDSAPMRGAVVLCGASMGCVLPDGRALRRHRRFETNTFLMAPGCACPRRILGVYGTGGPGGNGHGRKPTAAEARQLMGIDWMTRAEISQAIPPAYTQHVGEQLRISLEHAAGERNNNLQGGRL